MVAEASRFPFTTRDDRRKSLRSQDKYEITAALGRRLNVRTTFDDVCSTRRNHPLVAWCFHALLTRNNIEGFRARVRMNTCSHSGWKDGLGEMRRARAGRHSKRTDAAPLDAAPHILELIPNDVQPHLGVRFGDACPAVTGSFGLSRRERWKLIYLPENAGWCAVEFDCPGLVAARRVMVSGDRCHAKARHWRNISFADRSHHKEHRHEHGIGVPLGQNVFNAARQQVIKRWRTLNVRIEALLIVSVSGSNGGSCLELPLKHHLRTIWFGRQPTE